MFAHVYFLEGAGLKRNFLSGLEEMKDAEFELSRENAGPYKR